MRKTTGGYFWDVLLLSDYNEYWEDFYFNLVKVLPCQKCIKKTLDYHKSNPIPKFKNTEEKNEYLWDLRHLRAGDIWRDEVKEKGYTLETWKEYLNQPFTRIN